jgi:hypothetical protein
LRIGSIHIFDTFDALDRREPPRGRHVDIRMLSRFLQAIGVLVVAGAALVALPAHSQQPWPPGPGAQPQGQPQSYQTQVCQRLEAQLGAIDRGAGGDPARAEQVRRYEEAASRQQAELDRMTAQGKRGGCEGSGFFLFNALQSQSQQCVDLNRQIARMRANLDRITVDLQRLQGTDSDRGEQKRSVMAALAQNNCGAQYRNAARAPGGFFEQLIGGRGDSNEPAPSSDLANPLAQSGTVRTVCVRTCDGYYFPVSYATNASRFGNDEKACQRMCPAAEVMLFSYPTEGGDIANATSPSGQTYSSLPNAFKYRQAFDAACSCKRAGQSWADALGKDDQLEAGDIVVTEDRAKQMSQPPAQKGQAKGKAAPAAPAAAPAQQAAPAAPAPPAAAAEGDPSKRTIRAVGPTFIPPKQVP